MEATSGRAGFLRLPRSHGAAEADAFRHAAAGLGAYQVPGALPIAEAAIMRRAPVRLQLFGALELHPVRAAGDYSGSFESLENKSLTVNRISASP